MRVLGIDPGLRVCGYSVVERKGNSDRLIEAGVFRPEVKEQLHIRLNQIAVDIDQIIQRFKPEMVSVEELYSHYAHPKTSILMGHARGVIFQRAAAAELDVRSYTATKVKKSLTGNGRATKEQMQRSIQSVFGLANPPEPADVADAIAIALCCIENECNPLNEVLK